MGIRQDWTTNDLKNFISGRLFNTSSLLSVTLLLQLERKKVGDNSAKCFNNLLLVLLII